MSEWEWGGWRRLTYLLVGVPQHALNVGDRHLHLHLAHDGRHGVALAEGEKVGAAVVQLEEFEVDVGDATVRFHVAAVVKNVRARARAEVLAPLLGQGVAHLAPEGADVEGPALGCAREGQERSGVVVVVVVVR